MRSRLGVLFAARGSVEADTSAATLLAVTATVRALGATVDALVEDVGDTR